jgi:hypothetical protein
MLGAVEQHLDEIRDCIGDTPWAAGLFLCRGGLVRRTLPQFTVLAVTADRLWALNRDDRRSGRRYELIGSWSWSDVTVGSAFRGHKLFMPDMAAAVVAADDDGEFVMENIVQRAS